MRCKFAIYNMMAYKLGLHTVHKQIRMRMLGDFFTFTLACHQIIYRVITSHLFFQPNLFDTRSDIHSARVMMKRFVSEQLCIVKEVTAIIS